MVSSAFSCAFVRSKWQVARHIVRLMSHRNRCSNIFNQLLLDFGMVINYGFLQPCVNYMTWQHQAPEIFKAFKTL